MAVEKLWIAMMSELPDLTLQEYLPIGLSRIRSEVDHLTATSPAVAMESTASFSGFDRFLSELQEAYRVRLVRVVAKLETCSERVRERDSKDHIDVSESRVLEINARAALVDLPWDAAIVNDPPAPDEVIVEQLRGLLA